MEVDTDLKLPDAPPPLPKDDEEKEVKPPPPPLMSPKEPKPLKEVEEP